MGKTHSKPKFINEDKATIATKDLIDILLRLRYHETGKIISELRDTKKEIDDSSYNSLDWDLSALLMTTCDKIDKLETTIISLRAKLIEIYRILEERDTDNSF